MEPGPHVPHILLAACQPMAFGDEGVWAAFTAALSEEGAKVSLWSATMPTAFGRRLEHVGVRLTRLNWLADSSLTRLWQAPALARRLAAARVALVHVFGLAGAEALLAGARRYGARMVLTPNRLPAGPAAATSRAEAGLGRLLARFDAIELPSRAAVAWLTSLNLAPKARLYHVPPALDIAARHPERIGGRRMAALLARCQLDPARRIVLLPGPIERGHGHLIALQAMAIAARNDFDLLILSDEPRDPAFGRELLALLQATGLAERVRFLAGVDDRPAAFALADLALYLPPASALEPMPLLEAQAAGVPAVAARDRGLEEFCLPAATCWLVPANDREALAAAIVACLSLDVATRARLAVRCRDFVANHFSPEQAIRARLDLYQSLLDLNPVHPLSAASEGSAAQ